MILPVIQHPTTPTDLFRCVRYACTLSTRVCIKRQVAATSRGSFVRGPRGDPNYGPKCEQGAGIKRAVRLEDTPMPPRKQTPTRKRPVPPQPDDRGTAIDWLKGAA